jgi:putative redox protein
MASKSATVTWMRDQTFVGESGGLTILMDNPGPGRLRRGPSPMELLLMALAGCTAIDIVSVLKKKRQDLTDLKIFVQGDRAEDHPMRFTSITVTYEAHGRNLSQAAVERAVFLSDEKYCSVSATLRERTTVNTVVRVVETPSETTAVDRAPQAGQDP